MCDSITDEDRHGQGLGLFVVAQDHHRLRAFEDGNRASPLLFAVIDVAEHVWK